MHLTRRKGTDRSGFTLVEVLIASSVSGFVLTAVLGTHVWFMQKAVQCRQYAYAQSEVRASSRKILSYIRNAESIDAVATNGTWVRLKMADGTLSGFSYENPTKEPGMGHMVFVPDISDPSAATNIIADGLTEVMTGNKPNIFVQTAADVLRVAYRVTEPLSPGECPAEVNTAVRLRNQ